jgi:hypothetical protein
LTGIINIAVAALRPLLDIFGAMKPIFEAVSVVMMGLANAIKTFLSGLIGGGMMDFITDLESAFRELAKMTIPAAAALANFLEVPGGQGVPITRVWITRRPAPLRPRRIGHCEGLRPVTKEVRFKSCSVVP